MDNFEEFRDESQFDDNLLRSIETLLDENTKSSGKIVKPMKYDDFGGSTDDDLPKYRPADNGAFAFGERVYPKWSNNESMENGGKFQEREKNRMQPPLTAMQQSKPPNFMKPMRKNANGSVSAPNSPTPVAPPNSPISQSFEQHQSMILNQYLQWNYEFLSAQADKLGLPLDQYIRNLMVATSNQSATLPFRMPQTMPGFFPSVPVPNRMFSPQPQRRFNKSPAFNKKN